MIITKSKGRELKAPMIMSRPVASFLTRSQLPSFLFFFFEFLKIMFYYLAIWKSKLIVK